MTIEIVDFDSCYLLLIYWIIYDLIEIPNNRNACSVNSLAALALSSISNISHIVFCANLLLFFLYTNARTKIKKKKILFSHWPFSWYFTVNNFRIWFIFDFASRCDGCLDCLRWTGRHIVRFGTGHWICRHFAFNSNGRVVFLFLLLLASNSLNLDKQIVLLLW